MDWLWRAGKVGGIEIKEREAIFYMDEILEKRYIEVGMLMIFHDLSCVAKTGLGWVRRVCLWVLHRYFS